MTGIQWADWIRPGDVIVDVGANAGSFTKAFAAATGATGRVIAFEPDPAMASRCRALATEGAPIEVRECAVGARQESSPFYVSKNPTQNTRYQATIAKAVRSALVVDCVTLDAELAGLMIHGLKIDAQGDDGWVLMGARETLARMPARAWVLFELWPEGLRQSGFDLRSCADLCHGWTVVAQGKSYTETTQTLDRILLDATNWQQHKHTNVLLRKG